jgi:hypothetical protein
MEGAHDLLILRVRMEHEVSIGDTIGHPEVIKLKKSKILKHLCCLHDSS